MTLTNAEVKRRYRARHPERVRDANKRYHRLTRDTYLDARPFAAFLAKLLHGCNSRAELARWLNMDSSQIRRILTGHQRCVQLSTVDGALTNTDTGLWQLYDPDTLEPT